MCCSVLCISWIFAVTSLNCSFTQAVTNYLLFHAPDFSLGSANSPVLVYAAEVFKILICCFRGAFSTNISRVLRIDCFFDRSRLQMFYKITVLKNFVKFTGKYLRWCPFQWSWLVTLLKKDTIHPRSYNVNFTKIFRAAFL